MSDFPRLIVIADLEYVGNEEAWTDALRNIASRNWDGKVAVQVRIKNRSESETVRLASLALTELGNTVRTILNGDPDTTRRLGYWGSHHSQQRIQEGPFNATDLEWVSVAVHSEAELLRAQRMGASALVVSPVFEPSWKSVPQLGVEMLQELSSMSTVPVYALGGVSPAECKQCLDAGAFGIATLSGVMGATDPSLAIEFYLSQIDSG